MKYIKSINEYFENPIKKEDHDALVNYVKRKQCFLFCTFFIFMVVPYASMNLDNQLKLNLMVMLFFPFLSISYLLSNINFFVDKKNLNVNNYINNKSDLSIYKDDENNYLKYRKKMQRELYVFEYKMIKVNEKIN